MNNSRASHYRHLLLHFPLLILLFGLWIQVSTLYDKQHQIHNIAMQAAGSSSTTHTAIAANTQITITDKDKQTQDTDTISRDTEHASYTMTEINTEVLDIRADISKDISKDGFKAVGDLAMREGWEDGSTEKTLAHAAMGAVVAGIGNGDALGGALGAGAAEAARPATADANDATQQSVSALVGAIAGGGTGASVGLDGEKYNRQLHQDEIKWIENHAGDFADVTGISPEDAERLLRMAALSKVDSATYAAMLVAINTSGHFTKEQIAYAQNYLMKESKGEAFVNKFAGGRKEQLFTTSNAVEWYSIYDPGKSGSEQITQTVIDSAIGAGVVKIVTKGGKVLYKVGSKYYNKASDAIRGLDINPLDGKSWNTQKNITDKVRNDLSRSQERAINNIDEKIHNLEVRDTLSGDLLDETHIKKLTEYNAGLDRDIASLENSLKNPNLSTDVRDAIQDKVNIANAIQNRIKSLLKD